jgi:uncharacterized tellurite resistance protein B-like protein
MTSEIYPPKDGEVDELLNVTALPEEQRVAFYGSFFAIAAADGVFKRDELNLIFETINMDGLSEHAQHRIWDYMVETPPLTYCTAVLSTSNDQVRCALMVYLIEIALADKNLDRNEEEILLQARHSLQISQRQIQAIERFICDIGLIRPRPHDYKTTVPSPRHRASVLTALGIPATAVYFSSIIGGINLPGMFSILADHGFAFGMLGIGATALVGTTLYLTTRLLGSRSGWKRAALRCEQRRRAQLAIRNLQDALSYLTTRTNDLTSVAFTAEADPAEEPDVFAEHLRVLQRMITEQQPTAAGYL